MPGPLAGLAVTYDTVATELRQDLRAEILRRRARPVSPACRLAKACG